MKLREQYTLVAYLNNGRSTKYDVLLLFLFTQIFLLNNCLINVFVSLLCYGILTGFYLLVSLLL